MFEALCRKMSISISWNKKSKYWALYRIEIDSKTFEFDGTDLIDSVSELAEATISAVIDGNTGQAAFEHEPGQHIINMSSLGNGKVEINLSWAENPYGFPGADPKEKLIFSSKVSTTVLLSSIISFLLEVKESCGSSRHTLGDFLFPDKALMRLKNA